MYSFGIGLLLVVLGLLLWLLGGWFVVGVILIVVGAVLFFAPGAPGSYSGRGP